LSATAKFAKLLQNRRGGADMVFATECAVGVIATFKIPRRERMSKGTSMKKDQKKPKKKR
jgi:hypothetical protein